MIINLWNGKLIMNKIIDVCYFDDTDWNIHYYDPDTAKWEIIEVGNKENYYEFTQWFIENEKQIMKVFS